MAEENRCPHCGAHLPTDAPRGVCPRCLMKAGLEDVINATLERPPAVEGPGTRISHYELLELIAEGGMGLVYLAEQKEPVKRRVAVKIIKPGMDSKQVIARFEAERQTLALLDHPNIAHVFDAGTTEAGRPYFVMEYVKGMSVTRYCDERKLNIEQRLRLFEQVCEAVHHAHQKGIIHRDIKPSNILVSVHGDKAVPKIIDFGIAKAITQPLTDKTFVTFQGQLLGTPEYMSPEQVDLATQDIDTRSDIYSLGVVLYELLAGVLPFERESLERAGFEEIQQTIREQEPASPSIRLTHLGEKARAIAASRGTQVIALARRLHRELEWIPLKAMRKDRCRRYKSASEMADDIRNYLNGNPLIAGPETAVYRVKKFVHKHAGSVATVALVAVAILLGLVISTAMYFRAEDARKNEAIARGKAEQAEEATKQKAEELRRTLYVNSIQLADAKHREGNAGQVRTLLDSCPEDLRGWEWDRLNYIHDESLTTLRAYHGSFWWAGALFPDGQRIVTAGDDKTIKVWDLATGEVLKALGGHEDTVFALALSPDGKKIASGSEDKTIKIWDAQTGVEIRTLRGHLAPVYVLAFSPNGGQIASGSYDRTIKVWDPASGVELMTLSGHKEAIWGLAFSPDNKNIVSGSEDKTIKLWDAETGAEIDTLDGHRDIVSSLVFSPDGKRFASGSCDHTIKLWDAKTGVQLMTLRGHKNWVSSVAFSPDGTRIVSGSNDKTIKLWDAETGDELRTFHGHCFPVNYIAYDPDGKRLISGSQHGEIKSWDLMTGRESHRFPAHSRLAWSVTFSPDCRQIVSCSNIDCSIKLWDAQTGEPIRTIRGQGFDPLSVAFSPDARRIVSGDMGRGVVRVWDTSTGAQLMALRGHMAGVKCAAFSPDGNRIVSASFDKTIKLWDATSGGEMATLQGHDYQVVAVAFSPDNSRIASIDWGGTAKIWDTGTGSNVMTLRGNVASPWSISFSPDGKRIASASISDHTAKIWDSTTGAELVTLSLPDRVSSVAFSPNSRRMALGCSDGTARLWDATTGAELLTLRAADPICDITFSPDGKTIATGTVDGNIILWESTEPAGGYEMRKNVEDAKLIVEKLYVEFGFYRDVMIELDSDVTTDADIRKVASHIANSRRWQDADKLMKETLATTISRDKKIHEYQTALEKAEKANGWEPNNPAILSTLGSAQYRLDSYEDALKTLTKSAKILSDAGEEPDSVNVAFTTMVLHKIGRMEEAKAALGQLRQLCDNEQYVYTMNVPALLDEAEKLLAGEKP